MEGRTSSSDSKTQKHNQNHTHTLNALEWALFLPYVGKWGDEDLIVRHIDSVLYFSSVEEMWLKSHQKLEKCFKSVAEESLY